ncbi:MAG: DnaJ domain-containing protein [Pseudomonadota bacterium]
MEKANCFNILQVSPDATLKEARKAYMRLVKRWHPDRFADNPRMRESAQEKLKLINSAYEEVKAAISTRIGTGSQRPVSKPLSSAAKKSSGESRSNIVEPFVTESLFSVFRNNISNRIRRFFSSSPAEVSSPARKKRHPPKADMPSGGKGEEKDFQKIFNDAVRSKTGKPYRPLKRPKRPMERSEKDTKGRAQNAGGRPTRSGRKTGEQVARVEPVSKIKGL